MFSENLIIEHRARMAQHLKSQLHLPNDHAIELSPNGRYQMDINAYSVDPAAGSEDLAVIVVKDASTGEQIARFLRDDDRVYRCWIERDGTDYLVCPEALDGQTVVNLTRREIASFWSKEETLDSFIWIDFSPSPDGTKLAVGGCYWACPSDVIVYDFRQPLRLPLARLTSIPLIDESWSGSWELNRWQDGNHLVLSQGNRERIISIPDTAVT